MYGLAVFEAFHRGDTTEVEVKANAWCDTARENSTNFRILSAIPAWGPDNKFTVTILYQHGRCEESDTLSELYARAD